MPRAEDRLTVGRVDETIVLHCGREHHHLSAVRRDRGTALNRDRPATDSIVKRLERGVPPRLSDTALEGRGRDVEARGDEPSHVHLRAGAEEDAVLVDQVEVAIRVQRAEDLAGIGLEDAVDGRGADVRLIELDLAIGGNVEAAPVEQRRGRRLVDGKLVARLRGSRGSRPHEGRGTR